MRQNKVKRKNSNKLNLVLSNLKAIKENDTIRAKRIRTINEDIDWLLKNNPEPSLEKDHIIEVLKGSIKLLYK